MLKRRLHINNVPSKIILGHLLPKNNDPTDKVEAFTATTLMVCVNLIVVLRHTVLYNTAYLIHIMELNRERTEALLIDSAAGCDTDVKDMASKVYGAVPQRIKDVIRTRNDEIHFIIEDTILEESTYEFSIPISTREGSHSVAATPLPIHLAATVTTV